MDESEALKALKESHEMAIPYTGGSRSLRLANGNIPCFVCVEKLFQYDGQKEQIAGSLQVIVLGLNGWIIRYQASQAIAVGDFGSQFEENRFDKLAPPSCDILSDIKCNNRYQLISDPKEKLGVLETIEQALCSI